jgi:hypothetical protein
MKRRGKEEGKQEGRGDEDRIETPQNPAQKSESVISLTLGWCTKIPGF